MPHICILQPYRPDTPPALLQRSRDLLADLMESTPGARFTLVRAAADARDAGPEKYAPHAAVRNQFLAYIPASADYVLWADADLIAYPATFVAEALERNPGGISAPVVLLDHFGWFYDIGGFIDLDGRPASQVAPWFVGQTGPEYALSSVGCLYLAPAHIYRPPWGLRYRPDGPVYGVEHHSVCAVAAARGVPVRAYGDLVATHAYLPDYGRPTN